MNKYQIRRATKAAFYAKNAANDDGAQGRIFELSCAAPHSRKTCVSKQGQADVFITCDGGHYAAECKTNGGRIGSLLTDKAPKFVIYKMDFVQKHKAGKTTAAYDERREIDPVLIPTPVFIAALRRFNAIKSTNGDHPEPAIQVSSKKFFEWLLDWPIPFAPGTKYTFEDFEGLA